MNTLSRRYLRIIVSVLLTLLCIYLLGMLRSFFVDIWKVLEVLVIPFIASLVVSYILQPVVALLVRRRVPRSVAILLIYFSFILFAVIVVMNCIPLIAGQLNELMTHLPDLVKRADFWLDNLTAQKKYLPDAVRRAVEGGISQLERDITGYIGRILTIITSAVNAVFVAFVVPFLVFYMLKDARAIGRFIVRIAPKNYRSETRKLLLGIDNLLGRYVRGQLLIMLIVGVLTYAGLLIIRMPYALTLASFMAMADLIPYIGSFIGAVPALILALFVSPQMALKVLIVNVIVQQLEGNLVSPQIMGRTLELHPMLIVASLLVGGQVAGVLGMIVAVPVLAVTKVVVRQMKEIRKEHDR